MNLKVLRQLSYGLYIITTRSGDKINGQIANSVIQISSEPPTIAVSLNRENYTHELLSESGKFAITILDDEAPLKHIGTFGFKCGRNFDKFDGVDYSLKDTLCPVILEHSLGYLELKVIDKVDVATHTVFIGEVTMAEVLKEGEPLTYSNYHKVKKGKTQKNAPTYIKEE